MAGEGDGEAKGRTKGGRRVNSRGKRTESGRRRNTDRR